jgi:opacity protein-like surface antigen
MTRIQQITPQAEERDDVPRPSTPSVRRRTRHLAGPALLLLCACLLNGGAHAQGFEYGPHIAYTKAADSDNGNYLVGGHMELRLVPFLGVRGAVDYRSSERFQVGTLDGANVRVKSVPVTVSGRLYLPLAPGASPFLQAGAGWYRVIYDYSGVVERMTGLRDQSVTTFGWHAGGGLRLSLSEKVSLSGEAQYVFVDPERKLDSEVRDQIRNIDYNTVTFGVGLSVGF